ncbi:ATP-binding cassette domain-containing protein [Candidatus Sodalis pierantonius]|uniref:ATP-binding cassette domain-containing protein n=1 Tax=Candidatus Sodalis pierantonii TaxID=1486991 RepID=UPI0004B10847|nr:ATP-binding cassette domain-containing protein [Candidatus Sodalis pierantonius]
MADANSADTGGALPTGAGNAIPADTDDALPAGAPLVRLHAVTKTFPGIIANNAISLALWPGELHVLLEENGVGKSTLVALLSGMLRPDSGRIEVAGAADRFTPPGSGPRHRHGVPAPDTGADIDANGKSDAGRCLVAPPARRRYAAAIARLGASFGVTVAPCVPVSTLSLGEQQQAEILRAVLRGSRVLILDEPTALLTPQDAERLGLLMRRLVAQGLAVVFITHKLNEALAWGDRLSVLRRGRKAGEIPPARLQALSPQMARGKVLEWMFHPTGEDAPPLADATSVSLPDDGEQAPAQTTPERFHGITGATPLLVAQHLSVADPRVPLRDITFSVAGGEILAIAGIDGNGQTQLAEALAG